MYICKAKIRRSGMRRGKERETEKYPWGEKNGEMWWWGINIQDTNFRHKKRAIWKLKATWETNNRRKLRTNRVYA